MHVGQAVSVCVRKVMIITLHPMPWVPRPSEGHFSFLSSVFFWIDAFTRRRSAVVAAAGRGFAKLSLICSSVTFSFKNTEQLKNQSGSLVFSQMKTKVSWLRISTDTTTYFASLAEEEL